MNPTLIREVETIVQQPTTPSRLKCERPLAVAAALLSSADPRKMTATTVVGVLGRDDAEAFHSLVSDLNQEYGLEARVKLHLGSYSVRFSRAGIDAIRH